MSGERRAVIFVNYRGASLIADRAAPLSDLGHPVVVVDNSGDYPSSSGIEVLRPGRNLGFGAGCNLALAQLPAAVRTVCFHNPDVYAGPAAIAQLSGRVESNAHLGLLAPAVDTGGRVRLRGFAYPGVAREAVVSARNLARAIDARPRDGDVTGSRREFGLARRFGTAALLVADVDALEGVGGFAEQYFLYGEDLDLWHRVRRAGWRVGFEESVVVSHASGTGSRLGAVEREVLRWLGVELFADRFLAGRQPLMRKMHRRLIPQAAVHAPALSSLVDAAWSEGASAPSTLAEVRDRQSDWLA